MNQYLPKTAKDIKNQGDLKKVLSSCVDLCSANRAKDALKYLKSLFGEEKFTQSMAVEVDNWVCSSQGWFRSSDLYSFLHISSLQGKKNVYTILNRLKEKGQIEKHTKKEGLWRRIERDLVAMDWINAPDAGMSLSFPFELEKLVQIFPSNIVCVAGTYNAGKTLFLLDFIRLNMNAHEIHYFNCEMGDSELKKHLAKFKGIDLTEWNFKAWERSSGFSDVVVPNAINVIDYLTETEEYYLMANHIKDIHRKLTSGIAIIGLQKNPQSEVGRGGYPTLDLARLYLSLNWDTIKIVKAKCWATSEDPNKLIRSFKLGNDGGFEATSNWYKDEEKEFYKDNKKLFKA